MIDHDYKEVYEAYPENRSCREAGCYTSDIVHLGYDVDANQLEDYLKQNKHVLEVKDKIDEDEQDPMLLPDRAPGYIFNMRKRVLLSISEEFHKEQGGTTTVERNVSVNMIHSTVSPSVVLGIHLCLSR